VLKGKLKYLPDENKVSLRLFWQSDHEISEAAYEHTFIEYFFNYDNFKAGDYSELQFSVNGGYLYFLNFTE